MATINNAYDIKITVNGKEFTVSLNQINFVIVGSIWRLTPKTTMTIKDTTGLLQESMILVPGTSVEILYTYDNQTIKGSYIIDEDINQDVDSPSLISGVIQIPLVHSWVKDQGRSSISYNNRISSIIKNNIINKYNNFDNVVINDTENDDLWFQALHTDEELIEEIFLPNAFSRNAQQSPFFAFINTRNEFNFRHYTSLMSDEIPDVELIYAPLDINNQSNSVVSSLSRKRMGYVENKDYINVNSYTINTTNGSIEVVNDTLITIPKIQPGEFIPIKKFNSSNPTHVEFYDRNYSPDDIKGERYFSRRGSIRQDVFSVTTPFNPLLDCGKVIKFKTFFANKDDNKPNSISQFSGKYLIEKCFQIWDGELSKGYTNLVMSRKGVKLTNTYTYRNELIQ